MKRIGLYLLLLGLFFFIFFLLFNLIFRIKAAKEELKELNSGKAELPKAKAAPAKKAISKFEYETSLLETDSYKAAEGDYKTTLL